MTNRGKKLMASWGIRMACLMGTVWVAVVFIVPYYAEMMSMMPDELPGYLKTIFNVSGFLQNNGMLLGMFAVLLFAGSFFWRLTLRTKTSDDRWK